jgi:hypothetical protein
MKLISKIILLSTIAMVLNSCADNVLDESSPNILLADNLYKDKAGFDAGINGLYDEARRARSGTTYGSSTNLMLEPAFIGVDNAYGNYEDAYERIFNAWGANNNASVIHYRYIWYWLYETINAANTIVNRANQANSLTLTEKNQVLAEARFFRAWAYRHLTYLWGDVPLTLEESSGTNIRTDWVRTPVQEVRAAMEADWLFAEQFLPETSANPGKVLKGAAQHYLAELYLATNKNELARDYALKVTTNANYRLVTARYGVNATKPGTAFTDMFLENNVNRSQGNTEALWVIQNELNTAGGEGNNIMRRYWVNRYYSFALVGTDGKSKNPFTVSADFGGRGIGRMAPTKFAFSIYSANDDRGSDFAWRFSYPINNPSGIPVGYQLGNVVQLDRTSNEKVSNPNWPSTRKWDYVSPQDVTVDRQYNDQVMVRTAETYLILAEAYFKLNRNDLAKDAINALRNRAHTDPIVDSQVTLDFILDERSRELFSEEERRYTLLRTGKWLERVKLYNKVAGPNVTDRDKLLPIPQNVIDANLTLKMPQNDKY